MVQTFVTSSKLQTFLLCRKRLAAQWYLPTKPWYSHTNSMYGRLWVSSVDASSIWFRHNFPLKWPDHMGSNGPLFVSWDDRFFLVVLRSFSLIRFISRLDNKWSAANQATEKAPGDSEVAMCHGLVAVSLHFVLPAELSSLLLKKRGASSKF